MVECDVLSAYGIPQLTEDVSIPIDEYYATIEHRFCFLTDEMVAAEDRGMEDIDVLILRDPVR